MLDAHHDAVGTLALLAHLDEARDLDIPRHRRQHRMIDDGAPDGRGREACHNGGGGDHERKTDHPTADQRGGSDHANGERHRRPQRGLLLRCEIEHDPEAERDRKPGREPPGGEIRERPGGEPPCGTPCKAAEAVGPHPSRRAGSRPPRRRPPARTPTGTATRTRPDHRGVAPYPRQDKRAKTNAPRQTRQDKRAKTKTRWRYQTLHDGRVNCHVVRLAEKNKSLAHNSKITT
jgi:hypothetical protein